MKSLIKCFEQSCKGKDSNSCGGINLTQLAVTAALFVLIGDFLAFIGAVLALQEECNSDDKKDCNHHLKNEIETIQQQLDHLYKKL